MCSFPGSSFFCASAKPRGENVRKTCCPGLSPSRALSRVRAAPRPRALAPGGVLLLDVDSTLPNLALMKLSRHFKAQGRRVVLAQFKSPHAPLPKAETIYASCVFATPPSPKTSAVSHSCAPCRTRKVDLPPRSISFVLGQTAI
jgi:hypothetical protein